MVSVVVDAISYREQNTENKDLRLLFFTKKKRKEKKGKDLRLFPLNS